MSRAEWELIEIARTRAMADRLQRLALERADADGCTEPNTRASYALGWLATHAADKIVRLENKNARDVPTRGQGAAAPTPQTTKGGGVLHLHAVEPRASRR